jgi:hypothetical protein
VEPVKKLYEAVVSPIAEKRRRLVSPVATGQPGRSTLDVADTSENEQAFGRPGASRGSSAYPKIRFVGLLESRGPGQERGSIRVRNFDASGTLL